MSNRDLWIRLVMVVGFYLSAGVTLLFHLDTLYPVILSALAQMTGLVTALDLHQEKPKKAGT